MLKGGEMGDEILHEIDSTLDRLIENAEALNEASLNMSEMEVDAFQKTQESLLAHLIHMDSMLTIKRKELKTPHPKSATYQIQEKLLRFEKLNANFIDNVQKKVGVIKFDVKKRRARKPVKKAG